MSQQVTIVILIDIQAALEEKTLEGNLYLLDNLRTYGSVGEGTGELITAVKGSHWCDGSQAEDIVLNWMVAGLGALPLTLPRYYMENRTKETDREWLDMIKAYHSDMVTDGENPLEIERLVENIGDTDLVRSESGTNVDLGFKALDMFGDTYADLSDDSQLSYLLPHVSEIAGEAVELGVIFPAQYGCPVPIKDGWYWSATVDTNKTGTFSYTMKITLFDRVGPDDDGNYVWQPVPLYYDAKIEVTNDPQRNGFTGAGVGFLPVV